MIQNNNSTVSYYGNNTGPYPITFNFTNNSQIKVTIRDANGTESNLNQTSGQYSVSGNNVTTNSNYNNTDTVLLWRDVDITQTTDFINNDALDAEILESALDKLTMISQQIWEKYQRNLYIPLTDPSAEMELPTKTERANKVLSFDANGLPDVSLGAENISSYMETLLDDADAATARSTLGLGTVSTEDTITGYDSTGATVILPDTLRASVEAATGGRMTVLYDDQGYPNYMVRIPAFNLEDIDADLGTGRHPAFIVNGTDKAEIFIGAFQATVYNSRALSLPGLDPTVNVDWDAVNTYCTNKGAGWHLMTNWEWAAVAWWNIKQVEDSVLGHQPRGNTDHGRTHDEYQETGTRQDGATYDPGESSGLGRILTGSGPATWRHDLSVAGIADLVGNIWEWVGGLKIDGGRIYMPSDNYYGQADGSWPATDVYFENDSGTLRLSDTAGAVDASISVVWDALSMDAGYDALAEATRKLMVAALIAPRLTNAGAAPMTEEAIGRLYANTTDERVARRGGYWGHGSGAGLGALCLFYSRSHSSAAHGCRPAFVAP